MFEETVLETWDQAQEGETGEAYAWERVEVIQGQL